MKEFIIVGCLFMACSCQSQVHIHKHDCFPVEEPAPIVQPVNENYA